MSRNLLNLALLAGIAILAAIAFYEPGLEQAETKPSISLLNGADIENIRIQRPNQADIELHKVNGKWQTRFNGQDLPANDWRIQQILPLVGTESLARFPADPARLDQYLLDKPKLNIRFDELQIDFGGSDPLKRRRYLRIGDMIHLIEDRFYAQLVAADTDYIAAKPLPAESSIETLALPGLRIRQQAGNWQLEPAQNVSRDSVNRLIDEWRFAQAMQVTRLVERSGSETISVQLSTGEELRFNQTSQDDAWILSRPTLGLSYHFPLSAQQRMTTLGETANP